MRSAERLRDLVLAAALCAAASGCTSLSPEQPSSPAPAAGAAAPADGQAKAQAQAGAANAADAGIDSAARSAFDRARQALEAGHAQQAEQGFLALTRSHPELGGPHANLGLIYREQGRIADAVDELERAVQASPQQPVYYNQLGIAYRQQGQFGKARDAYQKAIALDPNYAAPYLNLGILHDMYLWDGKRALELYDRYLALSPGGDDKVSKWIVDLRNRNRQSTGAITRKEQQ